MIPEHSPCFENSRCLLHILALAEDDEELAKQISNLAHNVMYEFEAHISECFRKLDSSILSRIKCETIYSSFSFELRAKIFVVVLFSTSEFAIIYNVRCNE